MILWALKRVYRRTENRILAWVGDGGDGGGDGDVRGGDRDDAGGGHGDDDDYLKDGVTIQWHNIWQREMLSTY